MLKLLQLGFESKVLKSLRDIQIGRLWTQIKIMIQIREVAWSEFQLHDLLAELS